MGFDLIILIIKIFSLLPPCFTSSYAKAYSSINSKNKKKKKEITKQVLAYCLSGKTRNIWHDKMP